MNKQIIFNFKEEITKYLKEDYLPNTLPQVLKEYLMITNKKNKLQKKYRPFIKKRWENGKLLYSISCAYRVKSAG